MRKMANQFLIIFSSLLYVSCYSEINVSFLKKRTLDTAKPAKKISVPQDLIYNFMAFPQGKKSFNSLASSQPNNIFVSSENVLYVLTPLGISISKDNGQTFITKTFLDGTGGHSLSTIRELPNKYILLFSSDGVALSKNQGETFSLATTENGLADDYIRGDSFDEDTNTLYVWHSNKGMSYSTDFGEIFTSKTVADGLGSDSINDILKDPNSNNLYVSTSLGVSVSTNSGLSFVNKTTADGLCTDYSRKIYIRSNSDLFILSSSGLSISTDNGVSFSCKTIADGLGGNSIVDMSFHPTNGRIYVVTQSTGVAYSTDGGNTFNNRTTANGLASNWIGKLYFHPLTGNIFVTISNSGIAFSTDGGDTYISRGVADNLPSTNVDLSFNPISGTIYVTSNYGTGVSISSDGGNTFSLKTTADGMVSGLIRSGAFLDQASSRFYFTAVGGVTYTSDDGASFNNILSPLDQSTGRISGVWSPRIQKIIIDENDSIYLAGSSRGFMFSHDGGSTFQLRGQNDGLGYDWVNDIAINESNGNIYAATSSSSPGGIAISTDGGNTFTNKTRSNGLGSNSCLGVFVNQTNGNVYAAAYNGFPSGSGGVSTSLDGGLNYTYKTTADGLGGSFVMGVYVDSSGTIYALTSSGLSISTDGVTYVNRTVADGLSANYVSNIYVDDSSNIFAMTAEGLDMSIDGGVSFFSLKTSNELAGATSLRAFSVDKDGVFYIVTDVNIAISTDKGSSFIFKNVPKFILAKISGPLLMHKGAVYLPTSDGLIASKVLD